jgi:hypothetical protein
MGHAEGGEGRGQGRSLSMVVSHQRGGAVARPPMEGGGGPGARRERAAAASVTERPVEPRINAR